MTNKPYQMGVSAALFVLTVWIFAIIGWVANIVKILNTMSDPIVGKFIIRLLGVVVAPLGALMGFI